MDKIVRMDKTDYYLALAHSVAMRGTCLRRNFGAVIVNDDEIVATGYAGAPRGRKNCIDIGECKRKKLGIPSGERYELCRSVHAEANAIMSAGRKNTINAVMYIVGIDAQTGKIVEKANCCSMCKRMVINAGLHSVIVRDPSEKCGYTEHLVRNWVFYDESLDLHEGY